MRNYIREKIRAGKFLIKSLHQRQQTILNIANEIVNRQREFMAKGVAASSRSPWCRWRKWSACTKPPSAARSPASTCQTPQGIFEMKYFFTAGIQTASSEACHTACPTPV